GARLDPSAGYCGTVWEILTRPGASPFAPVQHRRLTPPHVPITYHVIDSRGAPSLSIDDRHFLCCEETFMYRRQVLKSVGTLAAGVGVRAFGVQAVATQASAAEAVRTRPIVTHDGTTLFHKDWGSGRPVLFVSSWGLNADMWAYQMVALSGPEVRCI